MTFACPPLLWLLIAPAALLGWELTRRRRAVGPSHPKILRAEAGMHSLTLTSASIATRRPARGARPWLWAGLACAVVALARPQWGRLEEPVFDQSREILLAIDLSRSMLTPDVKPSRLDRAKLLIQSLLEKLEGERVGLVVFSGTAFLQSPLSSDYEILREFLPSLGPDFLPEGGSNYSAMLETSVQAFGNSNSADRFLIILSDGESTEADWKTRIAELKKKSIRAIGLGIGTPAGGMIPDGSGGFAKDERGAVVLSKLESGTLQELAQSTGGVYRDASTWIDLAALVEETIETGRKGNFVEKNTVRLVERFQWPLALGLWCLFVSLCYEFPVRPRPREIKLSSGKPAGETGNRIPETGKLASATLLLMVVAGLGEPTPAFAAATLAPKAGSPTPAAAAPAEPSALSRMVGRISGVNVPTGRDWAELARETVSWGSKIQSEQQPVPPGPVHDALHAVNLGSKIDAKTADWPKLRAELEALLKTPDQQKQDQDKKDQDKNDEEKKDQKDEQDKDQQKQDQQKQDEKQANPQDQKDADQRKKNQPFDQNTKPPEETQPKPGESAFGDMKDKAEPPPPPPPTDTQKVGGAPEKKDLPPEATNPALALPLQKLEQLRNQDSPARLFELMQGENKPTQKKTNKDW